MSIEGRVREWDEEAGWGVIDSPQTPGGCWTHFSAIRADGYRRLRGGDGVAFEYEPAEQDGFRFRAVAVWPPDSEPSTPSEPAPDAGSSSAYRSRLTLRFDDGRVVTGEDAHELIRRTNDPASD